MVVVCGYGPQLHASPARKEQFWEFMDREVSEAAREDKMLKIQMDSNCWLGENIIPGDPNKTTNSNGRIFNRFCKEIVTYIWSMQCPFVKEQSQDKELQIFLMKNQP